MKKIISLLLVAAMLLTLSACSGLTEDDIRGEISSKDPSSDETEKETEAETEPQFSMGKSTLNSYSSDFIGLTVTLPDDWKFYSDEEILAINNITKDYYEEDALALLEQATLIYDMYATNESNGSSITIILEKLNALQIATLNYKATIEAQFDTLRDTLGNMGYSDIEISYKKIAVDGEEIDGFELSANIYGIEYNSTTIMFRRGNYLVNISVNSFVDGEIEALLGGFDFE